MADPISRVDAVYVIPVLTTYVDGIPVAEQVGQQIKVFLAPNPDVREAVSRVLKGDPLPQPPAADAPAAE